MPLDKFCPILGPAEKLSAHLSSNIYLNKLLILNNKPSSKTCVQVLREILFVYESGNVRIKIRFGLQQYHTAKTCPCSTVGVV